MFAPNTYLYALTTIHKLGPKRLLHLLNQSNWDTPALWAKIQSCDFADISSEFLRYLAREQKKLNLYEIEKQLDAWGFPLISICDEAYPKLLKQIPDPPSILFYRGKLIQNDQQAITVVGTRTISQYGFDCLHELLVPLCKQGIAIMSGLAYGIDAHAHRIAITENTYTAAVLGSGIDRITPSHHELLAQEIIDAKGGILSEFPPGIRGASGTFPRRNRILAGLTNLTLVVEAAEKSGALITAKYALDYNRDIATIPGSIFSQTHSGCHNLAKQGARLITSSSELAEMIEEVSPSIAPPPENLTDSELEVLELLSLSPQQVDLLAQKYSGRSAELFSLLTKLELKKIIYNRPGEGYLLKGMD